MEGGEATDGLRQFGAEDDRAGIRLHVDADVRAVHAHVGGIRHGVEHRVSPCGPERVVDADLVQPGPDPVGQDRPGRPLPLGRVGDLRSGPGVRTRHAALPDPAAPVRPGRLVAVRPEQGAATTALPGDAVEQRTCRDRPVVGRYRACRGDQAVGDDEAFPLGIGAGRVAHDELADEGVGRVAAALRKCLDRRAQRVMGEILLGGHFGAAQHRHFAAIGRRDGELAVDQGHVGIGEQRPEPVQAPCGERLAGTRHGDVDAGA